MNSETAFKINRKIIEKVENIKYLGFITDKNLNLKDHVNYIYKKSGKNWILQKNKKSNINNHCN